jgi:hypothetical protein
VTIDCKPGIAHISHLAYATMQTSSLVNGYLVGLSEELNATVEKHIVWMETQHEPDRLVYSDAGQAEEVCETPCMNGDSYSGYASGPVEGIGRSTI